MSTNNRCSWWGDDVKDGAEDDDDDDVNVEGALRQLLCMYIEVFCSFDVQMVWINGILCPCNVEAMACTCALLCCLQT